MKTIQVNESIKIVDLVTSSYIEPPTYFDITEIVKSLAANSSITKFELRSYMSDNNETDEYVTQDFCEILSANFTIVDLSITLILRTFRVCRLLSINFDTITDRNKEIQRNMRFVRSKVAQH